MESGRNRHAGSLVISLVCLPCYDYVSFVPLQPGTCLERRQLGGYEASAGHEGLSGASSSPPRRLRAATPIDGAHLSLLPSGAPFFPFFLGLRVSQQTTLGADSFSILFSSRALQKPAISPGLLVVF